MGFIGSLFDSSKGAGFQAGSASIQTPQDLMGRELTANQGVNSALDQQQAFLNALGAQGGIGNQSSVFGQQQNLANQLGLQAQGQGPNPAQAQLAMNTAANTANQAALMAGQRGAGANAGMIARQAGMQGGANQQNMVGQQAIMQAQQQLAAQQQLQQQQAMMAGLATQQVGQQQQGIGQYGNMAQNQQSMLLNAMQGANQSNIANQSQMNQSNAAIAGQNAKTQAGMFGGLMGGLGASGVMGGGAKPPTESAALMAYNGGMVDSYAEGGKVKDKPKPSPTPGPVLTGADSAQKSMRQAFGFSDGGMTGPQSHFGRHVNMVGGGKVPGQARVSGDSLKNDTVPAMLSPKEIVIPRSITQGKNAPEKSRDFVAAILAKNGMRK